MAARIGVIEVQRSRIRPTAQRTDHECPHGLSRVLERAYLAERNRRVLGSLGVLSSWRQGLGLSWAMLA
jgi:hypothetical protein